MSEGILDASAVLAILHGEPGQARAGAFIRPGAISTVNLCEVMTNLTDHGVSEADGRAALSALQLLAIPFDEVQAYSAARLRPITRRLGLSFADRACLALALERALPVVTADRAWANLDLPIEVVLIR